MSTQSPWHALFITVLSLTALACITINVYFPEAAVRDLSEKIEDAVAREAEKIEGDEPSSPGDDMNDPSEESQDGEAAGGAVDMASTATPTATPAARSLSRLPRLLLGTLIDLTAGDALAQGGVAAPEISNPAIRKIIQSRAQRLPQLDRYKSMGVLGENNRALVEIRTLEPLELRSRAAVQKLVREENADRDRMFREIAAATSADLSQLGRIQATYAETLRRNARRGDWIQLPGGQWQQKG